MFLIPIVGGLVAGLLLRDQRKALLVTLVLWLVGSGLLIAVTLADETTSLTVGTWVAVGIGLIGFLLAWGAHRLRWRE